MEISIPLNNVNPQYIYFAEKKKNVIVAGDFIKLIYSTSEFEMTGLYVLFELQPTQQNTLFKTPSMSSFRSDIFNRSNGFVDTSKESPRRQATNKPFFSQQRLLCTEATDSTRTNIKPSTSLRSFSDIDDNLPAKRTIIFDPYLEHNYRIIQKLCKIEQDIIENYTIGKCIPKFASYVLKNQLLCGALKCHSECKDMSTKCYNNAVANSNIFYEQVILKISGIWETDTNVGITMKFLILQNDIV